MAGLKQMSDFNVLLDKATSTVLYEPDDASVQLMCDIISADMIDSTCAIQAVYEKLTDDHPLPVFFALKILEKIFHTCGSLVYKVMCTKHFMDLLKNVIQTTDYASIRNKTLEIIQVWAETLQHSPQYSAPKELLRELQADGYVFPGFDNDETLETEKQALHDSNVAESKENKLSSDKQRRQKKNHSDNESDNDDALAKCFKACVEIERKQFKSYLDFIHCVVPFDDEIYFQELQVLDKQDNSFERAEEIKECRAATANSFEESRIQKKSRSTGLSKEQDEILKVQLEYTDKLHFEFQRSLQEVLLLGLILNDSNALGHGEDIGFIEVDCEVYQIKKT